MPSSSGTTSLEDVVAEVRGLTMRNVAIFTLVQTCGTREQLCPAQSPHHTRQRMVPMWRTTRDHEELMRSHPEAEGDRWAYAPANNGY